MFDIGFWELLFVLTIGLLVLGPDKLPSLVATAGRWLGRARVLARGLKMQIEREFDQPVTTTPPTRPDTTPTDIDPKPSEPEPTTDTETDTETETADDAGTRE